MKVYTFEWKSIRSYLTIDDKIFLGWMKISHKDVSSPSIEITLKKISRHIKFIRWIFQTLFRKSYWFLIILSPWKLCNTSIPYSCTTFFWLHNYKELRCCTTIRFRLIVVQCCCTTIWLIFHRMLNDLLPQYIERPFPVWNWTTFLPPLAKHLFKELRLLCIITDKSSLIFWAKLTY